MRHARLLAALVLGLPATGAAQSYGLPLVNNGVPTGVSIAGDVGFPSDEFGGGTSYGGQVRFGGGVFGLTGAVTRLDPDASGLLPVTSYGAAVTARLFGGPLVPFRVLLQGGIVRWDQQSGDILSDYTRYPVSLGFAATIPVPAFAIKPWIAPRADFNSGGELSEFDWGVSGGIEVGFLNGLSLRASYDRSFVDTESYSLRPSVWSVGLGWGL